MLQAIRNLLMEAIARAPEGGGVRISFEKSSAALALRITVEAHAPRVSADDSLDPAYDYLRHGDWLDEPITAQRLRVCRLIAEAHGGSFTIASARHTGLAFTLRLPLTAGQQPS